MLHFDMPKSLFRKLLVVARQKLKEYLEEPGN
jgi:hypothetical protein